MPQSGLDPLVLVDGRVPAFSSGEVDLLAADRHTVIWVELFPEECHHLFQVVALNLEEYRRSFEAWKFVAVRSIAQVGGQHLAITGFHFGIVGPHRMSAVILLLDTVFQRREVKVDSCVVVLDRVVSHPADARSPVVIWLVFPLRQSLVNLTLSYQIGLFEQAVRVASVGYDVDATLLSHYLVENKLFIAFGFCRVRNHGAITGHSQFFQEAILAAATSSFDESNLQHRFLIWGDELANAVPSIGASPEPTKILFCYLSVGEIVSHLLFLRFVWGA